MAIWRLSPVDLSDPNWQASSHRAAAIVRAPDEQTAREVAEAAFSIPARLKPHARVIAPPWKRRELVMADRITDERFEPEGPSVVLVPTFERDLMPKKRKV